MLHVFLVCPMQLCIFCQFFLLSLVLNVFPPLIPSNGGSEKGGFCDMTDWLAGSPMIA